MKLIKSLICIVIFCCCVFSQTSSVFHNKYDGEPQNVDVQAWICQKISPNGIIVSWKEKYGGTKVETCIGLWFSPSKNMYRLTWKDEKYIEVEKQNITDIIAVFVK
jgi:hypothetical protein